jgi:hypothetical protein
MDVKAELLRKEARLSLHVLPLLFFGIWSTLGGTATALFFKPSNFFLMHLLLGRISRYLLHLGIDIRRLIHP